MNQTLALKAIADIEQGVAMLKLAFADEPDSSTPDAPAVEPSRIAAVGKVAERHLAFLEEHGTMTVADSREIRRELYPEKAKMRATANLFGLEHSGAILWRVVEYGTRINAKQEVRLTAEGEHLAQLYRATFGVSGAAA